MIWVRLSSVDLERSGVSLFGTYSRPDDRAPIDVLAAACETSEFGAVAEAARAVDGLPA